MTDEVERIKLAGQIDISCVQAFHTLKEIDEMIEIAKNMGLPRFLLCLHSALMWRNG